MPGRFVATQPNARPPTRVVADGDEPIYIHPDEAAEDVLALLMARHLHAAPVIDTERRLIGFVSLSDLVAQPGSSTRHLVDDVMCRLVIAVRATASVTMAAALMAYEGLRQLPIVDVNNRVLGLLSALDVLRWLAEQDGYCMPSYTQRDLRR